MTAEEAKRDLSRLAAEHVGALLFLLGMLGAVVGASVIGAALIVVGVVCFATAIVWANIEAFSRRSAGTPLSGSSSVTAEANRLTGWWYVPDACHALGFRERNVRRALRFSTIAAVATFVVVPVVALLAK